MKHIISLIMLLLTANLFALNYDFNPEFIYSTGSTGNDESYNLFIDDSGNKYITGYFSGNVDFDNSESEDIKKSAGVKDAFLVKINKENKYEWSYTFGSQGNEIGYSVVTDKEGNVYLTGTFENEIKLDEKNILKSKGFSDIFLIKLDKSGKLINSKSFGSAVEDKGLSLYYDNENLYLTGSFGGKLEFSKDIIIEGYEDGFLAKLNLNFEPVFAKSFEGINTVFINHLQIVDGDIYLSGYANGEVKFARNPNEEVKFADKIYGSAGDYDSFIVILDSNGYLKEGIPVGWSYRELINEFFVDKDKNIYITGSFNSTMNWGKVKLKGNKEETNKVYTTLGGFDTYVAKLDSKFKEEWFYQLGTDLNEEGLSLVVDDKNIFVASYINGYYSLTMPYEYDTSTVLDKELLVTCLNKKGELQYHKTITATGEDVPYKLAKYDNSLYIIGYFVNNLHENYSSGLKDLFLIKFKAEK